MSVTAKDVAEIMKLLDASAFDELVLETGDLKLRLRRNGAPVRAVAEAPAPTAPLQPKLEPPAPMPQPLEPGVSNVPSPLLGIFYHAPKPGAEPFVKVGQRVEPDTIIGIVEVMKLMNTVRAGVAGELVEIVAPNAKMVEYGEPLIRVRTA